MTFAAILALLKRIPWWLYVGVVAAAALWWLIADVRHYRALSASQAVTIAQVKDAQAKATVAAQAAHDAQEQRYKDLANAADQKHVDREAVASTAVDEYIRTHRLPVCPTAGGAAGGSVAGTDRGNPESAVRSDPAPDMVAVTADDIHVCTDNTLRLESAHDWAAGLNP